MALATNRPDGWPQVTAVGYVNDGFLLYCFVAANSQKRANVLLDPRVSAAIASDAAQPCAISGLSLAGHARLVGDRREIDHISRLRLQRYPEYAEAPRPNGNHAGARIMPQPPSDLVSLLRIEPEIFSLLDYSKGFGHSELITFSERDLDLHLASQLHRWDRPAQ